MRMWWRFWVWKLPLVMVAHLLLIRLMYHWIELEGSLLFHETQYPKIRQINRRKMIKTVLFVPICFYFYVWFYILNTFLWLWASPWATYCWVSAAAPPGRGAWWRAPTSTRRARSPAASTRAQGPACRRSERGSRASRRDPSWRTRSLPERGSSRGCSSNLFIFIDYIVHELLSFFSDFETH